MGALFEELDYVVTPIGAVSLRRRRLLQLDIDVFEVMLGDEHLMSSLFTAGERALATLGLGHVEGECLDVVVGGLGLGYTADEALKDKRVRSLIVVEFLEPVIDWHRRDLVPLKPSLASDPRCTIVHGDFFAMARGESGGFDPSTAGRQFDAVLLDIDHAPDMPLNAANLSFYTADALAHLANAIKPGGVFAMWSDSAPDQAFLTLLARVFATARAEVVRFENPLREENSACTIYVANTPV